MAEYYNGEKLAEVGTGTPLTAAQQAAEIDASRKSAAASNTIPEPQVKSGLDRRNQNINAVAQAVAQDNQAITSDNLKSNGSVYIPPTQTQTAAAAVTGAAQSSVEQYINNQERQAQQKFDAASSKTQSLQDQYIGVQSSRAGLEADAKLPELSKQANDAYTALQASQRAQTNELRALDKAGMTDVGRQAAERGINRKYAFEQADLNISLDVANRSYSLAQANVDRKIELQLEPLKTLIGFQEGILNRASNNLSQATQNKLGVLLEQNKREYESEQTRLKTLEDTRLKVMIAAQENGADQATLTAIQKAKTPEEAISAAGSSLASVNTQIVEVGGRQKLINTRTGSVVADLGSSISVADQIKLTEGGYKIGDDGSLIWDGSTGVDSGVASVGRQIQSGSLSLKDVPKEDYKAVAQWLDENKAPLDPVTEQAANDNINLIKSLTESPALAGLVGNYFTRNRDPLTNARGQYSEFIAGIDQLISQTTLEKLIQAKGSGATFGALSEGELQLLNNASTKLNSWAVREDGKKDGKILYFDVSEKAFKEELGRIQQLAETDLEKRRSNSAPKQFNSLSDYAGASQENLDLLKQLRSTLPTNPYTGQPMTDKDYLDILQPPSFNQGGTGQNAGASTMTPITQTISRVYPTGATGGQCGDFAHKLVQFPSVGNSKEDKIRSVAKFGIPASQWKKQPQVGDVIITGENPTYGHVAVINAILPDGRIQVSESNFKQSNKVSNNRILSVNSPKIYGAIRGKLKV